jgi:hypothetical protein
MNHCCRYRFATTLAWDEIESSLLLALWATEGLHGLAAMHLETHFTVDQAAHSCAIETSTRVGRDLNRIFTSFLLREHGDHAFSVLQHPMKVAAA